MVASLIESATTPELRRAMNGGLARQVFRRARAVLDAELSLDASPEEMCTLQQRHLEAALVDLQKPGGPPPR